MDAVHRGFVRDVGHMGAIKLNLLLVGTLRPQGLQPEDNEGEQDGEVMSVGVSVVVSQIALLHLISYAIFLFSCSIFFIRYIIKGAGYRVFVAF